VSKRIAQQVNELQVGVDAEPFHGCVEQLLKEAQQIWALAVQGAALNLLDSAGGPGLASCHANHQSSKRSFMHGVRSQQKRFDG